MTSVTGQRLRTAVDIIEGGISAGAHIGAQLYVSINGRQIASLGIGEARPGVPMTDHSITKWLSMSKPITAAAVAQQWERGRLDLDDPVADHIPEFAANGKEVITIRHLLTHTGGFRAVIGDLPDTWDEAIARICEARREPDWAPGRKAGYHVATSWFILGELMRRVDGRALDSYVREEIFGPIGMADSWLAMPPEAYESYGDRMAVLQDMEGDRPAPHRMDSPEQAARLVPGGSGRGPMREMGRFYEMLLAKGSLNKARILSPQTVEAMTTRQRAGMFDETFKHTMDWGLGFIIDSKQYGAGPPYGYGRHASPRAFGHGGYQSSVAMADPEHGLVVALMFNGIAGEPKHQARQIATLEAIYEELDLAA